MSRIDNMKKSDDILKKLPEIQGLLQDMVAELKFRGCDENHKLFKQALSVNEWLQKVK